MIKEERKYNLFLDYIKKKNPHCSLPNKSLDFCYATDPIAVKTHNKKTPYVKTIIDWFNNGYIILPEDCDKILDLLQKYHEYKNNKGFLFPISHFKNPSDLFNAIKNIDPQNDEQFKQWKGEIAFDNNDIIVYIVNSFKDGEYNFAGSHWCVARKSQFNFYGPPFHMICDKSSNKRLALLHLNKHQLRNVDDKVICNTDLAKKICPFIQSIVDFYTIDDRHLNTYAHEYITNTVRGVNNTVVQQFTVNAVELPRKNLFIHFDFFLFFPEDILYKNPNWVFYYINNYVREKSPEYEKYLLPSAEFSYDYAKNVLKSRWPEAEAIIASDPKYVVEYARYIIKDRWVEAEPTILTDPNSSFLYASNVIKGEWKEAESIILTDAYSAFSYVRFILKKRWKEAEPLFKNDYLYAYEYAIFIKERLPEYEPIILTNASQALAYACICVKERWPEAEDIIKSSASRAYYYTECIIKGRWKEAEEIIMQDPKYASMYLDNIIANSHDHEDFDKIYSSQLVKRESIVDPGFIDYTNPKIKSIIKSQPNPIQ